MKKEKRNKTAKSQVEHTQQTVNNISVFAKKGINLKSESLILIDADAMRKIACEYSADTDDQWKTAFTNELITKISDELERISQV